MEWLVGLNFTYGVVYRLLLAIQTSASKFDSTYPVCLHKLPRRRTTNFCYLTELFSSENLVSAYS